VKKYLIILSTYLISETSWIKQKTNETVLDEFNKKRTMINTIIKKKIKLIGYLLRHNEINIIVIKGKINGKRIRGRQRKSFFEEIFNWIDFTSYQLLKKTACDRHECRRQGL
jgi:hypothetical protein